MIGFFLGLFVGTNVGIAVTAFLLFVSRRGVGGEEDMREVLGTGGTLAAEVANCPEGSF